MASGGLIGLILFSPYKIKAVVGADFFLQDRFLDWMPAIEPLGDIVFLGIDEASLNVFEDDPEIVAASRPLTLMAEPFPWSREVWGLAIERLTSAGARLVVLDLVLGGPRDGDEVMKKIMGEVGNRVVLGSVIDYPGQIQEVGAAAKMTVPSSSILPEGGGRMPATGYVNFWTDYDGVVRRVALNSTLEGAMNQPSHPDANVWQSISAVLLDKLSVENRYEGDLGMWQIPMMGSIDSAYPMISFYELFWPSLWEQNFKSGEYFRDKVVMIGPAAAVFQDSHTTSAGNMTGPLLHLNAFTAAARGALYKRASHVVDFVVVLITGLVLVLILSRVRLPVLALLVIFLVTVVFLGGWVASYLGLGVLLSLQGPLVCVAMLGSMVITRDYLAVWRDRQVLRQSLEQRVSPEIMAEILASPDGYLNQVGGVRKNVSILFSDLRGFTSLSESMEPEQLVAQLNEYLDVMVGAILSDKGMVVTFIGDAVMAVWGGVPDMDEASSSEYSVRAGCLMRTELKRMNKIWAARGMNELRMGIGVNRGVSIVGNIGSARRLEYAVIGDSTNLAARVESLTKQYGIDFAISETVAQGLDSTWRLRTLDRIRVVGKKAPVTIYEVLGKEGGVEELDDEFWAWCQEFSKAFDLYQNRDFGQAALRFDELLEQRPSDLAAQKMAGRCRLFVSEPPPEDWQGCVSLEKK